MSFIFYLFQSFLLLWTFLLFKLYSLIWSDLFYFFDSIHCLLCFESLKALLKASTTHTHTQLQGWLQKSYINRNQVGLGLALEDTQD